MPLLRRSCRVSQLVNPIHDMTLPCIANPLQVPPGADAVLATDDDLAPLAARQVAAAAMLDLSQARIDHGLQCRRLLADHPLRALGRLGSPGATQNLCP